MALDAKFATFKEKYDLGDEAMAEMLSIFNDSFIELAHKLLQQENVPVSRKQNKKDTNVSSGKKFATKIAAEYAAENGLTINDFDKEKITKKDVDICIKMNKPKDKVSTSKDKVSTFSTPLDTTPVKTDKKTAVKCSGIAKNGEPCNRAGTETPEGSSKCFCFRHAPDWKLYEISSDSDLEIEEPAKEAGLCESAHSDPE